MSSGSVSVVLLADSSLETSINDGGKCPRRCFFCGSFLLVTCMLHVGVCCAVEFVPCSLVVTWWERADLLAVIFVVFYHFLKCVLVHICDTGLSPLVKHVTDRSKAVLLWIFYVFSVLCLLCLCVRLFICALWSPGGKGLTSRLSFVVSNCVLSLSNWYPDSGVVHDCIDS